MGIFTEFMWMLAGGTYAAGKTLHNNLISPAPPTGPYVKRHGSLWYEANWSELNHKRQRELGEMYMTNPNEYDALAYKCGISRLSTCQIDQRMWGWRADSGRNSDDSGDEHPNRWLRATIQAIAKYEGWEADISAPMIVDIKIRYGRPTEYEEKLGEHRPPHKLLVTNPQREAELYAKVRLAQMGVEEERQYFLNYATTENGWEKYIEEYCFNGQCNGEVTIPDRIDPHLPLGYRALRYSVATQKQDILIDRIMNMEGFVAYALTPLCAKVVDRERGARQFCGVWYNPGWTAIKDLIDQKTAELIAKYQNHERQEELLRMLHYACNGNKDAKREFYTLIQENGCIEDGIIGIADMELLIDDAEQNKNVFGKNGSALALLKLLSQKEGWLWDECYPSQSKRMELEDVYAREKSYTDPTTLPYNHERQEELFKARFKAAEQRDKEAKNMLLAFTGTRNSHTMKEEKFFALCQTCAKDENWSWDRNYLTPEKCRELVRQCVTEES